VPANWYAHVDTAVNIGVVATMRYRAPRAVAARHKILIKGIGIMRFITFQTEDGPRLGLRQGDEVVDLAQADASLPRDLIGLLAIGGDAMEQAEKSAESAGADARVPYEGLHFLPVIPNPSKIICLGLNYAAHAAEGGHDRPTYPSIFMRGANSLTGHLQPIIRPLASEQLDYEAEMVAVVGKTGRHVKEADALDMIAGYSIFNEGSVREFQRKTSQWSIGKNFDQTGGFGPDFITADEMPPGGAGLRIQSRLNGEIMQDDNTDNMLFPVAETIAILTECLTLQPGDVIVTGTPSGVGHAHTPPVWMKDGDVCEIEIEGMGVLRNPIKDEVPI
jgi:acylpyruvate hydrolase